MKLGLVIPLCFLLSPLFSQTCDQVAIPPIRYFEIATQDTQEIHSYLVPCSESRGLKFIMPSTALAGYLDPDPSTPAGIILVVIKRDPGKEVLTNSEFEALIYRDVSGTPLFFTNPDEAIQITSLLNLGDLSNEFVLMPVMVSNVRGTGPASWFEENCVRLFRASGITLITNPAKEYDFTHFDEINFIHWPADTSIIDFFDFTFTDQKTGNEIPYTMTGNRSFRLQFPEAKGIFNYERSWKNKDCQPTLEIGANWAFPTVEVRLDTVAGYRNIEKCVPVRVFNFESVTGFELTLTWDGGSVEFSNIHNIHPALESFLRIGNVMTLGSKQGIHIELPSGTNALTLEDNVVLFEWCGRPLMEAGEMAKVDFAEESDGPETHFMIYGLETDSETLAGGIFVQEDREIIYDLNQQCNTRDGKRRIELDVVNDEAYPYAYSFNSPLVNDSTVSSIPFLIPDVPPGQYEFTIRDSFGYETTETIIVQESVPPDFQMIIDEDRIVHPTCLNPFGGQIAVSLTPVNQNYQLDLLNDAADFVLDSVSGLVAGRYIIQAENDAGCIDTLSYTLRNPREINISWEASQLVLCPGEQEVILYIEDQYTDPDTTLEYQLDGGQIHKSGDSIILNDAGNYPLQVWNGDGCTLDTTVVVKTGPAEISVWDTTSMQLFLGDTLNFVAPEPPGLTDLQWDFNGGKVGDQADIQLTPEESGILNFSATVYDHCFYTDSLMVRVIMPDQGSPEFAFPNVFTPNGDGVNDVYRIIPTREIQRVIGFQVYDRYGNYIYESDYGNDANINSQGWNGSVAGLDAPPGVYAVQVEVQLLDGRNEQVGFDLLLLR